MKKRLIPAAIVSLGLVLAAQTLPLALLLLDWWPLGRLGDGGPSLRPAR